MPARPWPLAIALPASLLAVACSGKAAVPEAPLPENTTYFPAWSAAGEYLAYSSNRTGNWELYRLHVADDREEQLTNEGAVDLGASWHPEGGRLAFWSDRTGRAQLYELDLQRSLTRALLPSDVNDRWPAWSPDGRELAFVSDRAGQTDLYLLAVADGSVRRLTEGVLGPFRPRWSPDGSRLVFTARSGSSEDIFSIDVRDRELTNETATVDMHEGNPAYSPDGRFIAFDAHSEGREESGDGKWEVWLLSLADRERRRLTSNDVDDWCPAWHPSGTRIAYLSGIANANYQVRYLDLDL